VGFLRRLLGGGDRDEPDRAATAPQPADPAELDADERAHELELARFEQDRTDDLVRRQQRFASYAWTPPAQGGERRAEDADAAAEREG
jgi:hypothetical protein